MNYAIDYEHLKIVFQNQDKEFVIDLNKGTHTLFFWIRNGCRLSEVIFRPYDSRMTAYLALKKMDIQRTENNMNDFLKTLSDIKNQIMPTCERRIAARIGL